MTTTEATTPRRRSRALAWVAAMLLLGGGGLAVAEVVGSQDSVAAVAPFVRPDLPVTANDLRDTRAQNTPLILADPTQARFVVMANRLDAPTFSCSLQVSGDGGRGWTEAKPVPKLPKGAERCYGPEAAFDNNGKLYYLFIGLAGRGNSPIGVFLTTSSDRARSFTTPRRILGPRNYQVRMALDADLGDQGRLHVVWLKTTTPPALGGLPPPPNPIVAMYSDDGGKTFSKPVQVNDASRRLSVAPAIAVGDDHVLHVVYYDLGNDVRDYQGLPGPTWDDGKWSLVHTSSQDSAKRFSKGVVVDDDLVPPERVMLIFTMAPPALAVDGSSKVYVGWYDARRGDWDVFLRASSNGGDTWGPLRRINDDPPGRHQYLPRLSVAPNGRLDAIFYDRRGDDKNRDNDVYYTFSTDGAQRFAPNLKLTRHKSDTRVGQRYLVPSAEGMAEIGSRLGLFSRRSSVIAAWADTRNAGDSTHQDLYATVVDVPQSTQEERSFTLPVALGAMGMVALAAAAVSARRGRGDDAVGEDTQAVDGPASVATT